MRLLRLTIPVAALLGAAAITANPAAAVDTRNPGPQLQSAPPAAQTDGVAKRPKKGVVKKKKAPAKKSERDFLDGYHHAHDLIYRDRDYAAAIVALRALNRDEHPDVANLVGFASRKLGRTEDAKVWYEKALAADPKHTRTWQYYGMWHLERGNRTKAEAYLETIRTICGTECEDYKSLKLALSDSGTY